MSQTANYAVFPFDLAYTYSYVQREAPDVELEWLDGMALNMDMNEWVDQIIAKRPDLLVTQGNTSSFNYTLGLLNLIKKGVGCKVAVGGWHVTATWRETLQKAPWVGFVLIHEFEDTVLEMIRGELDPIPVRGIAYRLADGRFRFNLVRPTERNIDKYPYPHRERETIGRYYDVMKPEYGLPSIQLWSSRGCGVGCSFCFSTVWYENPLHRNRDVVKVVDEMDYCIQEFGAKQFYFDDDTVTLDKKHLANLCREIKTRGDYVWSVMGDVTVSREEIRMMRQAGCVAMKVGIETLHPEEIHKNIVTPERALKFRQMCREEGMWVHGQFMFGFPHDTHETLKATLKFIEKLHPDTFQVYGASPLPNTEFYRQVKSNGWLLSEDWNLLDANRLLPVSYPWLSNKEIYGYVQKGKRLNDKLMARRVWGNALKSFIHNPLSIKSAHPRELLNYLYKAI